MKNSEEKGVFTVHTINQIKYALYLLIGDKLINDGYADVSLRGLMQPVRLSGLEVLPLIVARGLRVLLT